MPKITDQEFDNLFREAAKGILPRQEQGDWQEMERRLEHAERDARARNISLYAMLGLLLVYSVFVPNNMKFVQMDRASVLPVVTETTAEEDMKIRSDQKVSLPENFPNTNGGEENYSVAASGPQVGDPGTATLLESGGSAVDQTRPSSLPTHEVARIDETTTDSGIVGRRDVASATEIEGGSSVVVNQKFPESKPVQLAPRRAQGDAAASRRDIGGDGIVVQSPADERRADDLYPLHDRVVSTASLHAIPGLQPQETGVSAPGKIVDVKTPVRHPLFVKLAVSPDFSSIDYGSAAKPGINLGPLLEYGISPRWSISSGMLWSKKVYDERDPEKSYGHGGSNYKAKMLEADCRVIDIPLNITYYLLPGRKTNLFVTVGTSSYLMLDETYVYTVARYNHDYEYVEQYSNRNMEWFSILNVSAGVHQQIGPRWFIQGEPFLKAPMKGVGEGKVNLVSAGVFVSVKYWINPR